MSRREEEFKHRTSIFEGAYRAWSHLGGLDPIILETKSAKELDPVTFPLEHDSRLTAAKKTKSKNDDGSARLEYPYEPLPRSGLSHPFIRAVLSPWLGPNADNDAIALGLETLRTWWQHRRKGENKSAIKTLGTVDMRMIVDKYTRHFFDVAHCVVMSDGVQPPRTLHLKMKQFENSRPRVRVGTPGDDDEMSGSFGSGGGGIRNQDTDGLLSNLTPLERIHMTQKHSLRHQHSLDESVITIKGKCIPGNIDLPGIVDAVKRHANFLAHRGGFNPKSFQDSVTAPRPVESNPVVVEEISYGNPNTTPIVFQTNTNGNLIVMEVDGITCAHCVKIVETVLKGCQGGKSPIDGLLDAAADRAVSCVVILIDHPGDAKRIAFESSRNLSLVGYTSRPKEVSVPTITNDNNKPTVDQSMRDALHNAVIRIAKAYPVDFFDFAAPCSCPDSGVYRDNCLRYVLC
jgi:hypothetical protein